MCRSFRLQTFFAAFLALCICLAASVAHAGPFDKLKKSADKAASDADKAKEDVEATTGKGKAADEESGEAASTKDDAAKPGSASGPAKVTSVSTRFDFVSGDSVLFFDDFTQDELGEFPARWRLSSGTFEVAEMEGERWLRCVSDDGHISMKVPPGLPEYWTLEFDAYGLDTGSYLSIYGLKSGGSTVWETMYPHSGKNMMFRCGEVFSTTALQDTPVVGRHRVMLMGRGTALKIYMDRERLASVPDITGPGATNEIDFRLWAPNMEVKPMITNVRFAEGCRPPKDMLAEGKLVTYGIFFATGSDVVQPESAPVLRQIAAYLEGKPDVRLKITGHTDKVGSAPSNLDLSKRRAASVAKVLSGEFKIAADRFQTDGKGDTQPLSSNSKPEGRAMNRRVEFAKVDGSSGASR